MASKYMKRCTISFVIKEMQIKTRIKYHHIPIRMAKNIDITKCYYGYEALELSDITDRNVKWHNHFGK